MRLMIDPNAENVLIIYQYQFPNYWQEEVKARLDVRIGVLEPVPIGEPVI